VQFVKKSWHHRNFIKGPNGKILLSIPIKKAPLQTSLCHIELANDYERALEAHWDSIAHAYKKSNYFNAYSPSLQSLFFQKYPSLTNLTETFLRYFCDQIGIKTPFVRSSDFILDEALLNSTEKVIQLCKISNITSLYDANGAQIIIDTKLFELNSIAISFQNYDHPIYKQQFGSFESHMSILDLLLNEGPNSLSVIKSGRKSAIVLINN